MNNTKRKSVHYCERIFVLAEKERLERFCLALLRKTDCVRLRRVEFESLPYLEQKNKPYTTLWLYRIYFED